MKHVLTLTVLALGALSSVIAQTTNIKVVPEFRQYKQHEHKYQIATNVADLFYMSPGVEFSYFTHDKMAFGAKLSVPLIPHSDFDGVYKSINNGARLEAFNKYFFNGKHYTNSSTYHFTRIAAQLTFGNLNYDRSDWFTFQEDNLNLLSYETREFTETVTRLNFSLAIGVQTVYDQFVVEAYAGLLYGEALAPGNIEAPGFKETEFVEPFSYWADSYVLPVFGLSLGFGSNRGQ